MKIMESISRRNPPWLIPLCIVIGSLLNAGLGTMDDGGISPLFLDSAFTLIFSAIMGPSAGIATAALTAFFSEAIFRFDGTNIAFLPCGIASAAIVGTIAKKGLLSTIPEALICGFLVAFADSGIGALIEVFLFGGNSGREIDFYISAYALAGQSLLWASIWARFLVNLIDKGVPVFLAFLCLRFLAKPRNA